MIRYIFQAEQQGKGKGPRVWTGNPFRRNNPFMPRLESFRVSKDSSPNRFQAEQQVKVEGKRKLQEVLQGGQGRQVPPHQFDRKAPWDFEFPFPGGLISTFLAWAGCFFE